MKSLAHFLIGLTCPTENVRADLRPTHSICFHCSLPSRSISGNSSLSMQSLKQKSGTTLFPSLTPQVWPISTPVDSLHRKPQLHSLLSILLPAPRPEPRSFLPPPGPTLLSAHSSHRVWLFPARTLPRLPKELKTKPKLLTRPTQPGPLSLSPPSPSLLPSPTDLSPLPPMHQPLPTSGPLHMLCLCLVGCSSAWRLLSSDGPSQRRPLPTSHLTATHLPCSLQSAPCT